MALFDLQIGLPLPDQGVSGYGDDYVIGPYTVGGTQSDGTGLKSVLGTVLDGYKAYQDIIKSPTGQTVGAPTVAVAPPATPVAAPVAKDQPNYVLWGAIALGAVLLLRK